MLIDRVWSDLATTYGLMLQSVTHGDGPTADVAVVGPGLPRTDYSVKVFRSPLTPAPVRACAPASRAGTCCWSFPPPLLEPALSPGILGSPWWSHRRATTRS